MSSDTSTPTGLPLRFHMLIVYKAMFKYGAYESAAEVFSRAGLEYKPMLAQIEAVRLKRIGFAGALC